MVIELKRFSQSKESTLGLLYINDVFQCFTLEDQEQKNKVMHETRIPQGTYEITLRTEGTFHANYKVSKHFKMIHKGMLWIRNIPGFEYVLIHTGNTDNDTSGCILIGDVITQNVTGRGYLAESTLAYQRVYPAIAAAILDGQKVHIKITNP
jgi:hypothetical protein